MNDDNVLRVIQSFRSGEYRMTVHAEREREADTISVEELEEAFGSNQLEQLEDYPDDPRGASGLFLGFTGVGNPIHAVIGLSSPEVVVVITVYRPDTEIWHSWRMRRPQ